MDTKNVLIIFFLILLEAVGILSIPSLSAELINSGVVAGDVEAIIRTGLIMLAISITTALIAIFSVRRSAQESQGLGNKIRKLLFQKIMRFSAEDLSKFGTPTLITRTTNDVMQIQLVTMLVLRLVIISPLMIIVATLFAYRLESSLAFVFAIVMPLIVIALFAILRWANPYFRQIQTKNDRINKVFREGLTGIRVIRAFNTTDYENDRFDYVNKDFRDNAIRAYSITNLMLPSFILIIGLSNVLIFTFGSQFIAAGQMEVGTIIAYVNYSFMILMSVIQLGMVSFMMPRAQVAGERINEVLEMPVSIDDPEDPLSLEDTGEVSLEFDNVSFQFPGAEKPAVSDINFRGKQGETIAIIGGTGSGKSTIVNLIPRLYEATSGTVRVNGLDVKSVSQENLRAHLGLASQSAQLFRGTIRSNLQYGKEDATDEEMWHALDIAQGKDFVENLPKQLDSRVEQNGGNFSGGQRQRISIARTIINQPDVYIFDDSFSALDFKTDAKLRAALKPETQDAVVLIVAQRVNTVIGADTILVLDNGQIVGRGTHEELLETNEVYQDIVSSQMKGEEI